jgi:hypothetical protein
LARGDDDTRKYVVERICVALTGLRLVTPQGQVDQTLEELQL